MPLMRNEYGLGVEELHKEAEDPKAVLDGVSVAALVGILCQIGDLTQFAAKVFHGLQEQVACTSSRNGKLVSRVQRIEASLPSLEKAILSQTHHLHFASTPGTEWHASIRDEHNHFIYDDLPHFIMDSYEECREPPCLYLLDRFDTGGPGSCLKRYTDPTFFRRASSCSEDCNTEKSQQERKALKIKKRRSWQRSERFTKSASILYGCGRMQYLSTGQGRSSKSHTGSTFDMTLKLDLGDQSDSRGSKDGTDFIDIVPRPIISTQPDGTKNKGLFSSVREAEVNTSEVEATSHSSCSTTWDGNPEILDRMDEKHDIEDTRQVALTKSSLPEHEVWLVNKKAVSQANGLCDHGSCPTSDDGTLMDRTKLNCGPSEIPHFLKSNFDPQEHHLKPANQQDNSFLEGEALFDGQNNVKLIKGSEWELETQNDEIFCQAEVIEWNLMDEIDSGTENFADALNTIESESESDFETEMRKEVQTTASKHGAEENCYQIKMKIQEIAPEDEEAVNGVSYQTTEKVSHSEQEREHLSTSYHREDDLEELENSTASVDFTQSSHNELESTSDQKLDVISQIASSFNVEPLATEITKSGSEAPGDERIFCASNVSEELSVGSCSTYPPDFWTNGILLGLQPSKPTYGSENRDILGFNDEDVGSFKHLSHQRSEKLHKKSMGNDGCNLHNHAAFLDLSNDKATPFETKVLVESNVKNASSEASTVSEDRSSLLFLLSRGLLKNRHESSSPSQTNKSVDKFQDAVVFETKQGNLSSPVHSSPPSPPLEHMKISFQPVYGFDTSRLKLKYPDRVDQIENNLDAFLSFQMVPESTSLQHDIVSDSDDDTFCRSHAYISDGSHSHMLDSDSEQWESLDVTESNDPAFYNGLHDSEDQKNVPLSGSSFGFAHVQEPTDEPPPLPPLQWRASRPQFDEAEGNQGQGSDTLSQQISDSAIGHSPGVGSTKLISTVQESATSGTPKKVEDQKLGQEKTYRADIELTMDDDGDFLHQIRTKSFNLKHTEPMRSTHMPLPTINNKITAILQKANAIRQAVGSDDGEDDSWSDT